MKTNYLLKSRWSIILALTLAFILSFNLEPSKVFAANSSASNAVYNKNNKCYGEW
jgi:hypothetical protein